MNYKFNLLYYFIEKILKKLKKFIKYYIKKFYI